ncbi:origin recognition complex subunit 4 [Halyomorpha halys]|uniref:origin recognition complex subunit 4 n=1 Tax=Halyomorpha halys TaxID=286706 RepID=UPI0006D50CCE|nr:origin recognition complex subunit 4 isoform X1 [Halyomorpha halys]
MKMPDENLELYVKTIRGFLKEKLVCSPLNKHYEAFIELLSLLKRTVSNGESDSALIVGPRGCGKSTLLDSVLNELSNSESNEYLVVKLNGLVQTDDNLALRTIIEQLHITELDGDQITGSFSDNLMFVLQSLKTCDRQSTVPIIFILDEFQLFCNHKNQTLLYNLFDISKSAQAPMCVIGVTTRYDITELLEKRVSSRFSHRQILLMPNYDLNERISLVSYYLVIKKKPPALRKVSQEFINEWDKNTESLLNSSKVMGYFRKQLDIEPSLKALRNVLFSLLSSISSTNPFLTISNFDEIFQKYSIDGKVEYLKDLSALELCLVVSMAHHVEIYEGEPFNFEMIIKRYLKFAQQNSSVQITHRPILIKALERIKELELILPVSNSNRNQKKEYVLYNLVVTNSQVRAAISSYNGLPTEISHWALGNVV